MSATRPVVLVVDDNAENRALAFATLDGEGYDVVVATGGHDGIAAFERDRPDCILLDIRMPDLDGVTACERIRARPGGAEVAIIFVTAQRDVATFDRAVAAGGDDFLTKPIRPDELIVRVMTALRLRRISAERGELYAEIKRQRDALQRLQLQKEQLVAFLVHDFKNPVAAIDLQTELIRRDAGASPRSRRAADQIRDDARALMRMITNLLDLGRADEGALTPRRERVAVRAVVDQAIAELAARAEASNVTLVAELEASEVYADRDLLLRVLTNLAENAIRHAPEGSAVTFRAHAVAGGVELRVADAGRGVPRELRDHVFERFRRGDDHHDATNRGLGLAFCKVAVEAQGGTIEIEAGNPGAVFCVRLADAG